MVPRLDQQCDTCFWRDLGNGYDDLSSVRKKEIGFERPVGHVMTVISGSLRQN